MPGQGLRNLTVSPLESLGLLEQSLKDHIEIQKAGFTKKLNLIIIGEGEACLVVYCRHYIMSTTPHFLYEQQLYIYVYVVDRINNNNNILCINNKKQLIFLSSYIDIVKIINVIDSI